MTELITLEQVKETDSLWEPDVGDAFFRLRGRKVPDEIKDKDFRSVKRSARSILAQCLPPDTEQATRTGLVVGEIQSGKTLSMTTVSALAKDNGFRIIIVFSGTKKNLFHQTRNRFERDLSGGSTLSGWKLLNSDEQLDQTGRSQGNVLKGLIHNWSNPDLPEDQKQTLFITVMKHHTHLERLALFLEDNELDGIPALVIDDEADEAGLNTQIREGDRSTTYERILQVRELLPVHTYLQYTATPQAPVLLEVMNALSPDFVKVLEPGDGYVGGETIFHKNEELLENIDLEELPEHKSDSSAPLAPPESLENAFCIFIVGVAIGIYREYSSDWEKLGPENRSMMVHPSFFNDPQKYYTEWLRSIRQRWAKTLHKNRGKDYKALLEKFRQSYKELECTCEELPEFESVKNYLYNAVETNLTITEVNSATGDEVHWDSSYAHVIVGGEKLNRGYTVRGLTVTYMPRGTGSWTADTIQQRARFLGYRRSYLGLCRIYLDPELRDAYRRYVTHENDLRQKLKQFEGRDLDEFRRVFFLDSRFKPTRRSVLSRGYRRISGSNEWFSQSLPHSVEIAESNLKLVRSFLSNHNQQPHPEWDNHNVVKSADVQGVLIELIADYEFAGPDAEKGYAMQSWLAHLVDENYGDRSVLVIRMDAGSQRKRTPSEEGLIPQIFQGEASTYDKNKEAYPGDRYFKSSKTITIQIHMLQVKGKSHVSLVPALGVKFPSTVPNPDLLIQ